LALFACQAQDQNYDPNWTRNFRVGGIVGFNISANFSMSGNFGISGNRPAGVYDDGYVRVDETGNAQGYTSFWGYNAASQYNDANKTLTMHSSSSFPANSSFEANDAPYLGVDVAYDGSIGRWNGLRIGWEIGFNWLPIQIIDDHTISSTVNRSNFSFNTGGIVMPTAPYNGGSTGIGPTILAAPTQLPGDTISGMVTGSRTLDVAFYAFKLGPTIFWDANRYIGISAGIGPAVGLVSGDLKIDETIILADGSMAVNKGKAGATDFTFGGYVNAMVTVHAVKNGDFYLGVQYMPMRNVTMSGGGREARLNLGGQVYLSAGFNWPF
jgi:hypothetical protein